MSKPLRRVQWESEWQVGFRSALFHSTSLLSWWKFSIWVGDGVRPVSQVQRTVLYIQSRTLFKLIKRLDKDKQLIEFLSLSLVRKESIGASICKFARFDSFKIWTRLRKFGGLHLLNFRWRLTNRLNDNYLRRENIFFSSLSLFFSK